MNLASASLHMHSHPTATMKEMLHPFGSIHPIADLRSPDEPSPSMELTGAATVAAAMIPVGQLTDGIRYDKKLVICPANSHLYVRIRVEEEMFPDDSGFTMVDYVPITTGELVDLKTRESLAMLDRIQELSKNRTCIATTKGKAQWANRVFYPHV